MEIKASERLLSLNKRLVVSRDVNNRVCVYYENCYVSDGIALIGTFGRGATFEDACENYLSSISGKTIVFDRDGGKRETVIVL